MQTLHIPTLDVIVKYPRSSRKDLSLTKSLQAHGQLQPVTVAENGHGYFLLDGHRRRWGAEAADIDELLCFVDPDPPQTEAGIRAYQYIVNEESRPLTYVQRARAYQALKAEDWKQKDIAKRFGKSDADVSLALAVLNAIPEIQRALDSKTISPSAVEPLLSLSQVEQHNLWPKVLKNKTVRGVRAVVQVHKIQRASGAEEAGESVIPEDIDPMEMLVLDGYKEAYRILSRVADTPVENSDIYSEITKIRKRIENLMWT